MEWTVLSDNRACFPEMETEHGLSVLLKTERHRLLLDTGASALFIRNAERLGIDLESVDYVFISHGHNDHAGGLQYFMEVNHHAKVIVSPHAWHHAFYSKRHFLHSITTHWPEIPTERLLLVDHTCQLADDISVIACIPQQHPLPQGNQYLMVPDGNGSYVNDDFRHELVLYTEGLLFTGCAHNGLENILDACPWPVTTVVGGFHLLDGYETADQLKALGQRLVCKYPQMQFYTSHCTGDEVYSTLKESLGSQLHHFQ